MVKNKLNYFVKYKIKIKNLIFAIITAISLISILILIPGLSACTGNTTATTETIKETIPQTTQATESQTMEISNLFDARDIKPGDTIAGMKVEFVDIEPGPDPNNEDNYFAIVKFSGKLELSGKYISYSDQPLLGRSIIFYPDKESANLIPRLKHDSAGEIWFVFENYDQALGFLSQPDSEGTATIIVDNYTINYTLEVVHTADIVEVLKKEITSAQSKDLNASFANKIIFSSSDGSTSLIYICNPDSSNLMKLIEGGIFTSPSWNSEHTKIALTSINPKNGISSLYIYDVKSKNMDLLLERFSPTYPSFSPDGNIIIFADFAEKDDENYEIFSIEIDGTDLQRLTNNNEINCFSKYSPDGSKILFSGEGTSGIQLYIMDNDGKNVKQITNDEFTNNHGIFFPDGSKILFESNRAGKIELFSMNLDGSQLQNITNNVADNFEASFSPDGKFIVYRSNLGSTEELIYDIFVMESDGSNQVNITQ